MWVLIAASRVLDHLKSDHSNQRNYSNQHKKLRRSHLPVSGSIATIEKVSCAVNEWMRKREWLYCINIS